MEMYLDTIITIVKSNEDEELTKKLLSIILKNFKEEVIGEIIAYLHGENDEFCDSSESASESSNDVDLPDNDENNLDLPDNDEGWA